MMGKDQTFGGESLLLMGVFFPIPFCNIRCNIIQRRHKRSNSQTQFISRNVLNGPRMAGTRLFTSFQLLQLTEQTRAANDLYHIFMLNQLRSSLHINQE